MDTYVAWLKREMSPLFEAGGTWWQPYHSALVQASPKPEPVEIDLHEAEAVLKKSGTLFLRYFTKTFKEPTEFWYVACDEYKFDTLSAKTKYCVRRGYKHCVVQQVDLDWLAVNGYECYAAAFNRYSNGHPVSQTDFERGLMNYVGGPFDCWGVFCEGKLATYCTWVIGDDYATALVLKSNPAYFPFFPVYVLMDKTLATYVGEKHKRVTYGFRPISHDTNIQEFLEKFGFHKVYCDLKVVYRPSVRAFVMLVMPFKPVLEHLPDSDFTSRFKGVLTQEEIRRSFLRQP